ncbi:hypothetical protein HPB47_011706 [Ixodes persulcatus]|uniref:Uncharacterized protein n=1 Tax=Ixodes persulcatus TaxID=34615 RepID=A0AC60NVJ6_IXOPE|nr:hypothetical protein HPB47_011706 [Ixodes persulcatus]
MVGGTTPYGEQQPVQRPTSGRQSDPTPAKRHLSESSSGKFAHTKSVLQDDEEVMDDCVLGSNEDGDFTTVGRKKKRTRHKGSQRNKCTVKLPNTARAVLFPPTVPATNLRNINRQLLSDELQALASGHSSEDGGGAGILELLILTKICGVPVRAFLPRSKNSRVGVVSDVDTDISEDRLSKTIGSRCPELQKEKGTCKVKVRENITFLEAARVVEEQRKIKRRNKQHVQKPGTGTSQPKSQTTAQEVDPGQKAADNPHNDGRDNHARGLTSATPSGFRTTLNILIFLEDLHGAVF